MEISTEKVTIEAEGDLVAASGADLDFGSGDLFIIPNIATDDLPDPSEAQGMIAYDTSMQVLVVCNGSLWYPVIPP